MSGGEGPFYPRRAWTLQWLERHDAPTVVAAHASTTGLRLRRFGPNNSEIDQVTHELTARGFPVPKDVIPIPGARLTDRHAGDARLTRWVEFEVTRRGRSHPPGAFGFELVFREPVRGPILLGYGCHYGLGQFGAVE